MSPNRFAFTVLGTTDLHGNCLNWDYFKNSEYRDSRLNTVGLAKISTLVAEVRAEVGADRTLLIDAGDTIQGTPLSYYYARIDPVAADGGPVHPMAAAMNAIGYDAAALGNHEFNYGIPTLRAFERQCDFPLLAANAIDSATGGLAFPPYAIRSIGVPGGPGLRVGVLGLTNPGIAVWDRENVSGRMTFPGIVEQAAEYVPRLRAAGADIVIAAVHAGIDQPTSYGDLLPWPEHASGELAATVPGIDAVLVGHAHVEVEQRLITNRKTGRTVVLSEPLMWGMRLSRFDFEVELVDGAWQPVAVQATVLNTDTAAEDPAVVELVAEQHAAVLAQVNQVIGTASESLPLAPARFRNTAVLDLIGRVQQDTVRAALAGTEYADLPVLAQTSPMSRTAVIPAGEVRTRDVAAVYPFENTLSAVLLTGAQLTDYLEHSARYYRTPAPGEPLDPAAITNVGSIRRTDDSNYDVVHGLSYDIDLAGEPGDRIRDLRHNGSPLDPDARFVLAVNNYRAAGSGGFPHVAAAEPVWSSPDEIRNTLIDWVRARGVIDPAEFASRPGWRLLLDGEPLTVED